MGNSGAPRHARAPVLRPPRLPGRRPASPASRCRCPPARRSPSAPATCPIRPRISIRSSVTINTRSTGRSPTRRSTPATTISTSSARARASPSAAQALKLRPWTVKIDGMVEKPQEIGIDDLIRKMPLEERLYRHRCVEAWSMAIPWSGFPLAKLVELAKPLSSAKYVRMETFLDPAIAPGQKQSWYPWPYVEGADHRGGDQRPRLPGHRRLRQAGVESRRARRCGSRCRGNTASSRSSRSCASTSPTSGRRATGRPCRPPSTASGPTSIRRCAHPRWSQATEELIGAQRTPADACFSTATASIVADLYKGLEKERLWA